MKIGSFLKELRKEKGLTQKELAEQLNVSNRSVSRWETGSTLPDISILIELAEYYEVDMKEIMDGERKSESMNEEVKDVMDKVVEYTSAEKEIILKTTKQYSEIAVIALFTGMVFRIIIKKFHLLYLLGFSDVIFYLGFLDVILIRFVCSRKAMEMRKDQRNLKKNGVKLWLLCVIFTILLPRLILRILGII